MKKAAMMKKGAAFTLAAIMAFSVSAPTAVFATTEGPEDQTIEAAPAAEKQVEPQAEASKTAPQAEVKQTEPAVQEESTAAEEPQYGEATGAWGYGNESQTTKWVEYRNGKETILVFSTVGDSNTDAENAVTQLLDENGIAKNEKGVSIKDDLKARVTQIVFESGITGIGWTALYNNKKDYQPLYDESYEVDANKTDLFNGFTKLTVVTPCETIKRIGWSAFRKCSNLKDFDFSKCTQLEEIMNQAFSECKSLNNVDLSNCNVLRTIAWSAFNGAGKGQDASLTLPSEGVLSVIGGYAFYEYAKNNSNGSDIDFSVVAGSVTQILQKAFAGSHLLGTITGFKKLETLGKDAIANSYVTYVEYDPSQEPEEEPPVQEEEPPVQEAVEEPQIQEVEIEDVMPLIEDVVTPVIQEVVVPVVRIEITDAEEAVTAVSAPTADAADAAATETAETAATSNGAMGRNAINDSAAPTAAPAQAESISDNAVPTAAAADEQGLPGYLFGVFTLASLMSLAAAIALMRKSYKENK